ncbi:MAG: hypothetical protein C0609_10215 [Deltaproteobacteria bacterium]|nr:MAG: hypothetical protein C0609_10215 [Deltaproteobacteria bacterium]
MSKEGCVDANERIYEELFKRLKSSNLVELAERKGISLCSDDSLLITSFGQCYRVNDGGVAREDGAEAGFKERFAIVNYLLSDGSGEPSGELIPFSRLGGFNLGRQRHDDRSLKLPILAKFGENYPAFAAAAEAIGGVELESASREEHRWRFYAFAKLPITLTFYERDMEFPPDVNVLFDSRALDFIGLSCLGFLPDYFVTALVG